MAPRTIESCVGREQQPYLTLTPQHGPLNAKTFIEARAAVRLLDGHNARVVCRPWGNKGQSDKREPPFQNNLLLKKYIRILARNHSRALVRLHTAHGLSAAPLSSLLASCLYYGTWVGLPSGPAAKNLAPVFSFSLVCQAASGMLVLFIISSPSARVGLHTQVI